MEYQRVYFLITGVVLFMSWIKKPRNKLTMMININNDEFMVINSDGNVMIIMNAMPKVGNQFAVPSRFQKKSA